MAALSKNCDCGNLIKKDKTVLKKWAALIAKDVKQLRKQACNPGGRRPKKRMREFAEKLNTATSVIVQYTENSDTIITPEQQKVLRRIAIYLLIRTSHILIAVDYCENSPSNMCFEDFLKTNARLH